MSATRAVVIYGAGGHGKVVLDALSRGGREVTGFLDDDPERAGSDYCGLPVLGALGRVENRERMEVVVAIGDPAARRAAAAELERRGYVLATVVHPAAVVAADVSIAPGAMIMASATINAGSRVGRCAIVNTGAIVDHDCELGDYAHVAPGARIAGNVRVGESALVGVGATVIPSTTIGADAVVGAGAVVVADVADGTTVVGVPAKPVPRPSEGHG